MVRHFRLWVFSGEWHTRGLLFWSRLNSVLILFWFSSFNCFREFFFILSWHSGLWFSFMDFTDCFSLMLWSLVRYVFLVDRGLSFRLFWLRFGFVLLPDLLGKFFRYWSHLIWIWIWFWLWFGLCYCFGFALPWIGRGLRFGIPTYSSRRIMDTPHNCVSD